MKRVLRYVLVGGVLLALVTVAGFVLGGPALVRRTLEGQGVTVGTVTWCEAGLCLYELARDGVLVPRAELGRDRVLTLHDPSVAADVLLERVKRGGGAAPEGAARVPPVLTAVRVVDARVLGGPVEVPPLTGEVWPRRHLEGEHFVVDDDTVSLVLPTPWGEVGADVRPLGGGVVVKARCAHCRVEEEALAAEPLDLPPVSLDATWASGVLSGTARVGEVEVRFDATPREGGVTGHVHLDPTPLQAIVAVFGDLVPEAGRAQLGGSVGGDGTWSWPEKELLFTPVVTGLSARGVVRGDYSYGSFTWMGKDPRGGPVLRTGGEGTPGWTPLALIGDLLPDAVVAAEDGQFWNHPGYSLSGMMEAAKDNADRGETWRGGSCLTQQLAKNLFLDGSKTYSRKLRELLYALDMERSLGKHRIMEIYLNVAEWGPGIVGARAAAETYFLKEPAGLLPEEAAWLASILPSPRSAYTGQFLAEKPLTERIPVILDRMRTLSPEARAAARARPVRFVPPPAPSAPPF